MMVHDGNDAISRQRAAHVTGRRRHAGTATSRSRRGSVGGGGDAGWDDLQHLCDPATGVTGLAVSPEALRLVRTGPPTGTAAGADKHGSSTDTRHASSRGGGGKRVSAGTGSSSSSVQAAFPGLSAQAGGYAMPVLRTLLSAVGYAPPQNPGADRHHHHHHQ
jgi:hypothetical protein